MRTWANWENDGACPRRYSDGFDRYVVELLAGSVSLGMVRLPAEALWGLGKGDIFQAEGLPCSVMLDRKIFSFEVKQYRRPSTGNPANPCSDEVGEIVVVTARFEVTRL